jgi:hypothetical protein
MSSTPAPIVDGATANPVRSMFQTDSIATRLIVRLAFTMRGEGLAQYVTGATW